MTLKQGTDLILAGENIFLLFQNIVLSIYSPRDVIDEIEAIHTHTESKQKNHKP